MSSKRVLNSADTYSQPVPDSVLERLKERKKRDKQFPILLNLNQAIDYMHVYSRMMLSYDIGFETLRDLLTVVEMYREGSVITPYAIVKKNDIKNKCFRSSLRRIDKLLDRGLVEILGFGSKGGKLLIPSKKALEELSELCK